MSETRQAAKHITIRQVALESGVSSATVSYVLNGKKSISPETKERVLAAVKKLDYVPNSNARSLSTRDSLLIGVLIPQTEPGNHLMFENPFYSEILSAIEYEARMHGYHLLIAGVDADKTYLNLARERNLDGIIAIGVYQDDDFYRQVMESGIPLVLVDSYSDGARCHNIRIDDVYGAYLAVTYLLDQGHRDIAFFCGSLRDNGVMQKRLDGYRQALEECGIPYDEAKIIEGNVDFENGGCLARRLLETTIEAKTKATIEARLPVSAVFAAADILAIGAIKAFYDMGLRIPRDLSIMGFDDLQVSRYVCPGLTTVRQDISLKGKKAMGLLVEHIRNPPLAKREEILPVSIIERGSVRIVSGKPVSKEAKMMHSSA
jgi:LacI family transcriptional regulator